LLAVLAGDFERIAFVEMDVPRGQGRQRVIDVGEQGACVDAERPWTGALADVKATIGHVETAAADRIGPARLVANLLEMFVDLAAEGGRAGDLPEAWQAFGIELDGLGHGRATAIVLVVVNDRRFAIATRG